MLLTLLHPVRNSRTHPLERTPEAKPVAYTIQSAPVSTQLIAARSHPRARRQPSPGSDQLQFHLLFVHRLPLESASIHIPPLSTSDCSGLPVGMTTVARRRFGAQIADVWWYTALVPSPKVAWISTGAGIAPTLSIVTEYPFPDGATADIARSM